ncbi:MAG: FAD-dependent thymidylate synthase [Candidatus Midichloria sp.]|nr:FAD-dependent thymidylate synthase [Candidatus Midichloria sp.]
MKNTTRRPTVEALEEILYKPLKALDHGFIRLIDYMGNDAAVVQAARVSYGSGTKKINKDKGLINYLMRRWHTTPFEMCEIKFHIKLPIFIARQWIRHRTANVNEYSGRYSIMDKEFYVPEIKDLAAQSQTNKQGRSTDVLSAEESHRVLEMLKDDARQCYDHYMEMLNLNEETQEILDPNKTGLTRELARMNLTLNYYTQWYWKTDLHNLLHFLRLRADDHAQYEIRVYADIILDIVKKWVPFTYEAFLDYRLNAVNISGKSVAVIKKKLAGENVTAEDVGISKREWQELISLLEIK